MYDKEFLDKWRTLNSIQDHHERNTQILALAIDLKVAKKLKEAYLICSEISKQGIEILGPSLLISYKLECSELLGKFEQYEEAMYEAMDCLKVANENPNFLDLWKANLCIANINRRILSYEEAITHFHIAYELAIAHGDELKIIESQLWYGNCLNWMNQLDEAELYLSAAISKLEHVAMTDELKIMIRDSSSILYRKKNNLELAGQLAWQNYNIYLEGKAESMEINILKSYTKVLLEQNELDIAYTIITEWYHKLEGSTNLEILSIYYDTLAEYYWRKEDYKAAYKWQSLGIKTYEEKVIQGSNRKMAFLQLKTKLTILENEKNLALKELEQKDLFIASVSHEMRTPLNGIMGMSELLSFTELTTTQLEYLQIIQSSSAHLMCIINNLLDLRKLDSGLFEINRQVFNLKESLRHCLNLLRPRAFNQNLFFHISIDNTLPEYVKNDPILINQVLMNLINNALKFTERGGVFVDIKCTYQTIELVRINFEVRDTGIGIPTDKLTTIFNHFVKVENHSKRRFEGLGLGLAISNRILQKLGSSMKVSSALGVGSSFAFSLDFPIAQNPEIEVININRIKADGLTALIVDDNTTNLLFLKNLLKSWQFNVIDTCTSKHAIQLINEVNFDLMLCDIQMPEYDGFDLIGQVIEKYPLESERPILIAVSANCSIIQKEQAINSGFDNYITKPFKSKELIQVLVIYFPQIVSYETDVLDAANISTAPAIGANTTCDNISDELMDKIMVDIQASITIMKEALNIKDFEGIRQNAHYMISSFSIVQQETIIALLQAIESSCDNLHYPLVKKLVLEYIRNCEAYTSAYLIKQ
jgi:signal transduction histidine kinase/CheY-like chemotaxis protein